MEAGQLQGPKDFKVIFGLPVSTSDTISLGDPYEDMTNYWVQVVLVYRASGGSILFLVSLAAVAGASGTKTYQCNARGNGISWRWR